MINFINTLVLLLTLLVSVYVISAWVLPPYHSFRRAISAIVEPMLAPIQRLIPPIGMFDFSPFIFIILLQVIATFLTTVVH